MNRNQTMVQEIINVLDGFKEKNMVINMGGSISSLKEFEIFDVYVHNGRNNILVVMENENGSEDLIIIKSNDIKTYWIDELCGDDNIMIDFKNKDWLQIYEQ
jgi:hypothetical protein